MSCAACSARVEKAVNAVRGVESCSVSLLTNSMGVTGGKDADIIKAVEEAGYGCSVRGQENGAVSGEDLADRDTPLLRKRLISSLAFLVVLLYFSMGHKMLGWPVPAIFDKSDLAFGMIQLVLAAIVMVINRKFFISGFKGLIRRAPNMDSLVAMGSAAGFIYSAVIMNHCRDLYFESSAMILTLITVGKMLEARSKGRTTDALKSLIKLAPDIAVIERDGTETEIPAKDVRPGDIFLVRAGNAVTHDTCLAVESYLTGFFDLLVDVHHRLRPQAWEGFLVADCHRSLIMDGNIILAHLSTVFLYHLESLVERHLISLVERYVRVFERSVFHLAEVRHPLLRDVAVAEHCAEDTGGRRRVAV